MPLPSLSDDAVALQVHAEDWRGAVALAGDRLAEVGVATRAYTEAMIGMIEQYGPYVVIAPGLALAHARPGGDVLSDGMAVVTLDEPVEFGHPYNDPVRVVLGLAVTSPQQQLQFVAGIANVFNDSDAVERIAAAASASEVREILGAREPGAA